MTKTKMTFLLTAILLTMVCVIFSCTSRGTPPSTEEVNLGEVGAWDWVMSTGGIAGITIYADSVDYTRRLVFDSDGNYVNLRDGQIESAGKYVLSHETIPDHSDQVWVVRYDNALNLPSVIERLDTDTLVLSPLTIVDGYTTTYVRSPDK